MESETRMSHILIDSSYLQKKTPKISSNVCLVIGLSSDVIID